MQHRVTVLAHEGLAPFELGVAAEVFALPRPELEVGWWYAFSVCAERPGVLPAMGGFGLAVEHGLDELARADTIVLPGAADVHGDPSAELVAALLDAHARGARLVSICSGAFVLAATGLLDGRRAATHWRYAPLLARRYPRVEVASDVLYVDGGDLLTSAGTAAGIDLCLHLVRSDHGARVANQVARRMVVPAHRDGGQAQFIDQPVPAPPADDPVARAMEWALGRLGEPIGIEDLARHAHLSARQFSRRFSTATGTSPGAWLLRRRLDASLPLLESSDQPVEQVGARVGFNTPAAFRRHFARAYGVPPSAWRRSFAHP
ncbi:MAG: AraC family transcriptional regulator, transcriptional activator FtrA [Thermoleophilaceae bacterium]|nr:AraC family transcriptional regulator, transcriptional activator FtrA [Thermoleophilaceae bacterium]